jgi:hypothetical protein
MANIYICLRYAIYGLSELNSDEEFSSQFSGLFVACNAIIASVAVWGLSLAQAARVPGVFLRLPFPYVPYVSNLSSSLIGPLHDIRRIFCYSCYLHHVSQCGLEGVDTDL